MKILIIEDELMIARRSIRMTKQFFGEAIHSLQHCDSLSDGLDFISKNEIDLLLLDLNLNGENGFDILENMVALPFHTIIISAYKDKAITAFEYGVLDFVPKPFNEARLHQALERIETKQGEAKNQLKYLAIQKKGRQILIDIDQIVFIKGARIYTEVFLKNQKKEIHNKSLDRLEQLLPASFERIHKSYLVDMNQVSEILAASGGKYALVTKDGEQLPVSRSKYKSLKEKWFA